MTIINCFLISVCWVLILDQFRFMDEITVYISRWLSNGHIRKPLELKPFSCSLCMSWWTNLIYIIIAGEFSVAMVFGILLISWTTTITNDVLTLVKTLILKILNKIM
jgi:hypothetical protein